MDWNWLYFLFGFGFGMIAGSIIAIAIVAMCRSASDADDNLEKIQGGKPNGESKRH